VTSNPFRQKAANDITEATLKRLHLPTLLITGDTDLYSLPALIRRVAQQILNSEVVIVHEAGHPSYWEQPEAFNCAVLDFLARHSK
jgi:pimeloyl-ACP methyl ester carboxylesterase